MIQLQELPQRSDGFTLLTQQHTLLFVGPPISRLDGVDKNARDRSPEMDEVVRVVCYSMLESLSGLFGNNSLHTGVVKSEELAKYRAEEGRATVCICHYSRFRDENSRRPATAIDSLSGQGAR